MYILEFQVVSNKFICTNSSCVCQGDTKKISRQYKNSLKVSKQNEKMNSVQMHVPVYFIYEKNLI